MIDRASVVAAARECLGTPFRHQGRRVGHGLDCAGVVVHVATCLALPVLDMRRYGRNPSGAELESVIDRQACLSRVDLAAWEDADVLLMRFDGDPQHLGIWTGSTLVHAYAQAGRCVEHSIDVQWRRRIVRAYQFVEVV